MCEKGSRAVKRELRERERERETREGGHKETEKLEKTESETVRDKERQREM